MQIYEMMPRLLNMSITAGIVILVVLAVRPLLRRAPRKYLCALWLAPLFRLLCPVSLSAPFSLLRVLGTPVVNDRLEYIPPTIVHDAVPRVSLPVQAVSDAVNAALPQGREQLVADPLEVFASLGAVLWLTGACAMLVWGAVSLCRIRASLRSAVKQEGNIWHADIPTAFVWGVLRPRIYLPFGLTEDEEALVLAHERMHIRRGDHILRVLMYLALCIHWFNPLVWIMFVLCGRDMEMACDAAVLAQAQTDIRADYAQALLRQAGGRAAPFSPLSFGVGDVKARIERILRFEGARSRFAAATLLAVAALGLCLLVNPEAEKTLDRSTATQYMQAAVAYLPPNTEMTQEEPFRMAVGEDDSLFLYDPETGWNDAGRLEEIALTADELREAFRGGAGDPAQWEPVDEETFLRSIRRTWQCRVQATQTANYAKNLDDGTEEERQLEESVMGVWTLFETANGNRYMAFSALGNWDALAANYASFFGADSVEWLGERPPSGWIGDTRQPTVFFMFRMEREVWNGYEMAQQELSRALIAEFGAVPTDWEYVSSTQMWSLTTLDVYYSPSEQLWGVAQVRYIDNAPEVYEVGLYPHDRHTVTVVETDVAVHDSALLGVQTERAVIGCVFSGEDLVIAYEDMIGHASLAQVKAEQPYILPLNPEQDKYSFEFQSVDGTGTSGSMTRIPEGKSEWN